MTKRYGLRVTRNKVGRMQYAVGSKPKKVTGYELRVTKNRVGRRQSLKKKSRPNKLSI